MKIDENKLDELLTNEMNPTESPAFRAELPQEKAVRFPKWLAAVAASVAIAVIATTFVLSQNRANPVDPEFPEQTEGKTSPNEDSESFLPWKELMFSNLITYTEDDVPQVLASANFSNNTDRNVGEDMMTYHGVSVTKELYDVLTSDSLDRTEQYAILLIGCGLSLKTYEVDETAPTRSQFEWKGKTIGELCDIRDRAQKDKHELTYMMDLIDPILSDRYNDDKSELLDKLKGKMYFNQSREVCVKYSIGWAGDKFDDERFLNDRNITIDFDRVAADLEETKRVWKQADDMIKEADEVYCEMYVHEVETTCDVRLEDLFRMMEINDLKNVYVYSNQKFISSYMSTLPLPDSFHIVLTPDEFDVFIEKAAQYEGTAKLRYGLATREGNEND